MLSSLRLLRLSIISSSYPRIQKFELTSRFNPRFQQVKLTIKVKTEFSKLILSVSLRQKQVKNHHHIQKELCVIKKGNILFLLVQCAS